MYFGDFSDWDDVMHQFEVEERPENVVPLFAAYHQEGYEGSALVVYLHTGRIWMVSGGHCSCYGLEGQWDPEETSIAALQHLMENGDLNYRIGEENVPAFKTCLQKLDIKGWEDMAPDVLAVWLRLKF